MTDRITIGEAGQQEVISNILDTSEAEPQSSSPTVGVTTPTERISQVETAEEQESHPEEQLAKEWTRISQMNTKGEATEEKNKTPKSLSENRIEQLRNQLNTLREMAKNATDADPGENVEVEDATLNAMGDVTREEYKINRGTNTSARVQNAFDEA